MGPSLSAERRAAHDAARECHVVALEALRHSLSTGGPPAAGERITMLVDTADICRTAGDFLQRGSPLAALICRTCAAVCRSCQQECERSGAEELRACAEACGRCANACDRVPE